MNDAAFVKAEPVVTAGIATTGAVALSTALMEVSSAFDWHTFTDSQTKAVIGLTAVVVSLFGSFVARRKVTPTSTADARVEAAEAPTIVTNVIAAPDPA